MTLNATQVWNAARTLRLTSDLPFLCTIAYEPEDRGLSDGQLIDIGLDNDMTIKQRWVMAPYVWNKKGLLYNRYKYLAVAKDESTIFDDLTR